MDKISENIPWDYFIPFSFLLLLVVVLVTLREFLDLSGGAFGRPSGERWQYFRDGFSMTLSTICSTLVRLADGLLEVVWVLGKLWQIIITHLCGGESQVANASVDV
ncbi:hypothetical protein J3E69DRAFT_363793 [Trichoderma sp. SZMC 28015]